MRKWLVVILLGVVAAAGAGGYLYFLRDDTDSPTEIMRSSDAQVLARGATQYRNHCAICHGSNLEGEANWRTRKADGTFPAPPHDAKGHTWHHPDRILFKYTKVGGSRFTRGAFRSAMPGFSGQLSDTEISQVIAYIKSNWPRPIQERQAAITEMDAKAK